LIFFLDRIYKIYRIVGAGISSERNEVSEASSMRGVSPQIILSILLILSKHLPTTPLPHLRFHKQKFKICFCLFSHRFRLLSRYLAEMCRLSVKIITSSGDSPPQFLMDLLPPGMLFHSFARPIGGHV